MSESSGADVFIGCVVFIVLVCAAIIAVCGAVLAVRFAF